jgi:hypothetical protein
MLKFIQLEREVPEEDGDNEERCGFPVESISPKQEAKRPFHFCPVHSGGEGGNQSQEANVDKKEKGPE